jgi:hypothetical protein
LFACQTGDDKVLIRDGRLMQITEPSSTRFCRHGPARTPAGFLVEAAPDGRWFTANESA